MFLNAVWVLLYVDTGPLSLSLPSPSPFSLVIVKVVATKFPSGQDWEWLLLLVDLYTTATGCRFLLRKIEFFKNISKQIKCITEGWNVDSLDIGGGKTIAACTNLCTSHCFEDCFMPFASCLFSFFFFFHSSKVSPAVRGRGEWGQGRMKWKSQKLNRP